MKKQRIVTIFFMFFIILMTIPSINCVLSLSKPTVSLSKHWTLEREEPYPNLVGKHDPDGRGLLKFGNIMNTTDVIYVFYENSLGKTYSNKALEDEATSVYLEWSNTPRSSFGLMEVAGVTAGFAKGYDSESNLYSLQIICVKENYYLDICALYAADNVTEINVMYVINSIWVGASEGEGFPVEYVLIGVIFGVAVLVVSTYKVIKRLKKTPNPPNLM